MKLASICLAFSAVALVACSGAPEIDTSLLDSPIKNAAELVTVTPTEAMQHAGNGKLSDGRNLNPVLSKSLRTFDTVRIDFPENTTETLKGISDYNVFAWRQVARYRGEGELRCDVAPAPVVDVVTILKVIDVVLRLGTVVATFEPADGKTLVTTYDSSRDDRLVSMEFRPGVVESC